MNDSNLKFDEFGRGMIYPRAFAGEGRRRQFIKKFKNEIVLLLVGLRAGQIAGQNHEPAEVPDLCNLCGAPITADGVYIDGMTGRDRKWAYMCLSCFTREGEGIGWGIGQLYAHNGESWQCIGGGNPEPGDKE